LDWEKKMVRLKSLLAAVAGLYTVSVSQVQAVSYFTNPTQVNLLERWNIGGGYGLATSTNAPNANSPFQAIDFPLGGTGFRGTPVGGPVGTGSNELFVRYQFAVPQVISKVEIQFRDSGHSPDNYIISDQIGTIASDPVGGGAIGGGFITHNSFGSRLSNYIDVRSNPRATDTQTYEIVDLGAYLAPGQSLAIDGTFNVFAEEVPVATGFNSALWTNREADRLNPGNANSTTWHFSKDYKFTGAYMSHEAFGFNMEGATIAVSDDGVNYTTVFGATDFSQGYMTFSQQLWGDYVRLSWANSGSGGGEEIHEFQLFAFLPEPGTAMLLPALAMILGRRRARTV